MIQNIINSRIPLAGNSPALGAGYGNALLAGQKMKRERQQLPLDNQLLQQRAQLNNQAMQDNAFTLEQKQKNAALTDQYRSAQFMLPNLLAMKNVPMKDREAKMAQIQALGQKFGVQVPPIKDLSDDGIDTAANGAKSFIDSMSNIQGQTAGEREFKAIMRAAGHEPGSKEYKQAADVWSGLAPRAGISARERIAGDPSLTGQVAASEAQIKGATKGSELSQELEYKPEIAEKTAAASKTGATKESRRNDRIVYGADAAKGIPTVRRALLLLDKVETGGVNAVSLSVRQRLGVESADEGELSNKLGKAVLSQLRATFGAQFTQQEGERLQRIEAGFGKSTATNRRLLKELLQVSTDYAEQAIQDAIVIEDYATAAAIKRAMDFEFNEDADFLSSYQSMEGRTASGPNGKLIYRNGEWVPM